MASVQVFATAMSGFSRSASLSPVAFNIARAGARLMPFLIASLFMAGAYTTRFWPVQVSPAAVLAPRAGVESARPLMPYQAM